MTRLLLVAVAALAALPAAALAQEPWRSSYFPYVLGNPTDGAVLVARWQRTRNAPYFLSKGDTEDVINPITFAGALSVEAGIGTSGTRFGRIELRAPGLLDGWRFRGFLGAERRGRFGYYGLGGDLEASDTAADPNANYYRVHRSRLQAQVEVTRRIVGPLRFSLGAALERTEFSPLPGTTLFRTERGAGYQENDFVLRPALVLDLRDREFTPGNGVLLEAGIGFGTARDDDDGWVYTVGGWHLRGWVSPREGTVLGGRWLAHRTELAAPFHAKFGVFGWERESGFAGADGHRSFPAGAIAGTSVDLVSLEVRHDLLNAGDLGAFTLVAFGDYARVKDGNAAFGSAINRFGGGGGMAVRVLRSAILSINFAGGSNGFNFSMGTGWAW